MFYSHGIWYYFRQYIFIKKLSTEAVSLEHGSPYFLFYENKDGIHFRSLDSLYAQSVVSEYNTGDFFHQNSSGTVVKNWYQKYADVDQKKDKKS